MACAQKENADKQGTHHNGQPEGPPACAGKAFDCSLALQVIYGLVNELSV
jgi:hypothetical protein